MGFEPRVNPRASLRRSGCTSTGPPLYHTTRTRGVLPPPFASHHTVVPLRAPFLPTPPQALTSPDELEYNEDTGQDATPTEQAVGHTLEILKRVVMLTAETSHDAVVPGLLEVLSALQMLLLKIQTKQVEIDGISNLKVHIGELSSTTQEIYLRRQAPPRKQMEGLVRILQTLCQPGHRANWYDEPSRFFTGDTDIHEVKALVEGINNSISVFLKNLSRDVRYSLPEIDRHTWVLLPLASSFEPSHGVPWKHANEQIPDITVSRSKKRGSALFQARFRPIFRRPQSKRTIIVTSDVVKLILDVWAAWLRCPLWEPGPNRKKIRSCLLQARLLSREYDSFLRPRIISQLRLSSAADIRILLKMLHNEDCHGRLSGAVKYLELLEDGSCRVDFERSCRLLAGKLPSLKELGYNVLPTDQRNQLPMISLPFKADLASFTELRVFTLLGVKILSFSALAQVLGVLPKLKQVALHHVEWIHEESYRGPVARHISFFSCLRLVIADDVVAWPLMHLWASMLERRCSTASEGSNANAESLALLMKMCCDTSSTTRMMMRYDLASDSIHISSYLAAPHWVLRIGLLTSGITSVIRSIQLRVADPRFFLGSRPMVDWMEVDHRLKQSAKKLDRFTIDIDPNHIESASLRKPLSRCFPELGKEIVTVNLAHWEGPGDNFMSMD